MTKQTPEPAALSATIAAYDAAAPEDMPSLSRYMRLALEIEFLALTDKLSDKILDRLLTENQNLFGSVPRTQRLFLITVLLVHICRRDEHSARSVLSHLDDLVTNKGSVTSWANNRVFETILAIYLNQVSEAVAVIDRVIDHLNYSSIPQITREEVIMIQMFLTMLLEGKEHDDLVNRWRLRLSKFLNQVTQVSFDKSGDNVMVYIIEVLWHIHYRSYGKADERIEALERYATRHGLRSTVPRLYNFTKLLSIVSKANYHPAASAHKAGYYLAKIENDMPYKINKSQPEYVPYEQLWAIVLRKIS